MDSVFATRMQVNIRFHFGTRRTKYLKSLAHWVQSFYRTPEEPKSIGLDQIVILYQLERYLAINEV